MSKRITNIDAIVSKLRQQIRATIQATCGTMRVLDMTQPIGLGDIYTDVNILEKQTALNRLEIDELISNCRIDSAEAFDRLGFGKVKEQRVCGLDAVQHHSRLMVLGKPGAGKTTFLKYLAIQSIQHTEMNQSFANYLPIFVTLKDFAELETKLSLLQYLANLARTRVNALKKILEAGRAFVLLDGLDEVLGIDSKRVNQAIQTFANDYEQNKIVVTCRIAAKSYTFQGFTEVEVADFEEPQIQTFVSKWFEAKQKPKKCQKFLEQLEESKAIKELANRPLLLMLLCLIFEGKGKIYGNRSDLYAEGVELLLEKWDSSRDIDRDEIYGNLSAKRRQDLLGKLALETFEKGQYFLKRADAERLIESYIINLPGVDEQLQVLDVNSKKVLRSIQAQHGLLIERAANIYSYSHLTFHEYFVAREISDSEKYQLLVMEIFNERWREVFLLTTEMTRKANVFLIAMKKKVEAFVDSDAQIQAFLSWNSAKIESIKFKYKTPAVRALYCYLARARVLAPDSVLVPDSSFDLALDFALAFTLNSARAFNVALDLTRALELARELDLDTLVVLLKLLCAELPHEFGNDAYYWWKKNGDRWAKQLQAAMIKHRNIGHDWDFTEVQIQRLEQYFKANKLLVDCLNSDCYVTREVRQEIEDTLLLPQVEIDRYYAQREKSV